MISKRVAVCREKNSIFTNFVRGAIGSSRDEPTRCSADVFAKRPAATACQRSNYANNWDAYDQKRFHDVAQALAKNLKFQPAIT